MRKIFFLLLSVSLVSSLQFCKKKDKDDGVCNGSGTYDSSIKNIISSNCSEQSCHGAGSPNPNFTSYASLKPYLDDGTFKRVVIDNKTMPKNSSLSTTDYNAIKCWAEAGYPEK